MAQLSFFDNQQTRSIVNVASVPQRSLFRYPGGKTWLVPQIRRWLASLPYKPDDFVEPFAGGGIASLTVVFEQLAQRATLVELDHQVASVWHTLIYGGADCLAERIAGFHFTPDSVAAILEESPVSTLDQAFQTILKNRVNRGGILAHGAGRIKNGENGRGLASRWYPQTLKQRIINIVSVRERLRFFEGDGMQMLVDCAELDHCVFFIDPPYTAGGKRAGSRLYTHAELDHEALFRLTATLKGDFLMTYDNVGELHELAKMYNFDTALIDMKNSHHAEMTELLIGRNLDWLRYTR